MSGTTRSAIQKFDIRPIERSLIVEAPYNPRIISEGAEKRLRDKIKKVGLLSPLIWNETTGNLVSGHQRLAVMDKYEGYPGKNKDYILDLAVVQLDIKTEKEMVVFLNNPSAQGEFDLSGLAELNLDHQIDFDSMGFSDGDIDFMFDGDGRFAEIFKDTEEVVEAKDTLKAIKDARSRGAGDMTNKDDIGFYFMVVCDSREEKERVLRQLGQPPSEEYISAEAIDRAMKSKK